MWVDRGGKREGEGLKACRGREDTDESVSDVRTRDLVLGRDIERDDERAIAGWDVSRKCTERLCGWEDDVCKESRETERVRCVRSGSECPDCSGREEADDGYEELGREMVPGSPRHDGARSATSRMRICTLLSVHLRRENARQSTLPPCPSTAERVDCVRRHPTSPLFWASGVSSPFLASTIDLVTPPPYGLPPISATIV